MWVPPYSILWRGTELVLTAPRQSGPVSPALVCWASPSGSTRSRCTAPAPPSSLPSPPLLASASRASRRWASSAGSRGSVSSESSRPVRGSPHTLPYQQPQTNQAPQQSSPSPSPSASRTAHPRRRNSAHGNPTSSSGASRRSRRRRQPSHRSFSPTPVPPPSSTSSLRCATRTTTPRRSSCASRS
jgi:hypothetical protein